VVIAKAESEKALLQKQLDDLQREVQSIQIPLAGLTTLEKQVVTLEESLAVEKLEKQSLVERFAAAHETNQTLEGQLRQLQDQSNQIESEKREHENGEREALSQAQGLLSLSELEVIRLEGEVGELREASAQWEVEGEALRREIVKWQEEHETVIRQMEKRDKEREQEMANAWLETEVSDPPHWVSDPPSPSTLPRASLSLEPPFHAATNPLHAVSCVVLAVKSPLAC